MDIMAIDKPMHKPIPKEISNFTLDKYMDKYEPWTKKMAWELYEEFTEAVGYLSTFKTLSPSKMGLLMYQSCSYLIAMQENDFAYWGSMSDRQRADLCQAIDTLVDIVNREQE
jgi:hypothetical protein